MQHRFRLLWLPLLLVLTFVAGGLGSIVLDRQVLLTFVLPDTSSPQAAPAFRLMAEAWNTIEQSYVDRADVHSDTLTHGAIRGMVEALGDTGHSRFLTPELAQEQRAALQGVLEGIGAEVQMKNTQVVIVAPLDGSPAQRAGLRSSDIIVRVDGADVAGLPLDEVAHRILGPVGTPVKLTVQKPEHGTTREVTIVRARITLDNVTWRQLPDTCLAHVRIASFSQGVTDDLRQTLAQIRRRNLDGIVLDLRNNPGGLLDEAVGTASQFLKRGDVLLEQDAQGRTRHVPVRPTDMTTDLPLVILVNSGTASSAEIVAGALHDAGRATIVGATTFGAGTVLNEFCLSDGSVLLLAPEKWLTPSGQVIWYQGIEPDVQVALPPDATPLLPETDRA